MRDLLWMEIDLNKIRSNLIDIQKCTNKKIIPVIKSNGYNLGDLQVMELVHELNLDYGAVVDAFEALKLLEVNPNYKILILNSLEASQYEIINNYPALAITINSLDDVQRLAEYQLKRILKVHIQVDTGMNRLGFTSRDDFDLCIQRLKNIKNVNIEGLQTHFSSLKNSSRQLKKFKEFVNVYDFKMIHLAASSTYLSIDYGNYVRVGLDIYGATKDRQSITIKCYPITINNVKKGESIGYDEDYIADEDIKVAILPIGYANGFRRSLKSYGVVANNKLYKSIGIVCMNHLFVKVDDDINLSTEFIITSPDYPIEIMAKYLNTIPHEILCMFNINKKLYIR